MPSREVGSPSRIVLGLETHMTRIAVTEQVVVAWSSSGVDTERTWKPEPMVRMMVGTDLHVDSRADIRAYSAATA